MTEKSVLSSMVWRVALGIAVTLLVIALIYAAAQILGALNEGVVV